MSTLSDIIRDVGSLLMPRECIVCRTPLVDGEHDLCTACRYSMPLTGFCREPDNPLFRSFWGIVPVERAAALFFFTHGGDWQRAIHSFKYEGRWRSARIMGRMLGEELDAGELFAATDLIIPVPLHPRRLLHRGYNQSEYIARGVADIFGCEVDTRSLVRLRNNPSQTHLHTDQKRDNVRGLFAVRHPGRLAGRRILLVDDVITSGETMTACVEALTDAVPDCRVSVAALAASRARYGGAQ